jgi:hypothetical protein
MAESMRWGKKNSRRNTGGPKQKRKKGIENRE